MLKKDRSTMRYTRVGGWAQTASAVMVIAMIVATAAVLFGSAMASETRTTDFPLLAVDVDGIGDLDNYLVPDRSHDMKVELQVNGNINDVTFVTTTITSGAASFAMNYSTALDDWTSTGTDYGTFEGGEANLKALGSIYELDMDFELDWDLPQGDLNITVLVGTATTSELYWNTAYKFSTELDIIGTLILTAGLQGDVDEGDWIAGGESVYVTGLELVYDVDTAEAPATSYLTVDGTVSRAAIDQFIFSPNQTGKMDIIISGEGMPSGKAPTPVSTYLNVDATPPTAPSNLVIHADSTADTQTSIDNDNQVYPTWTAATDVGSGIAYYLIEANDDSPDVSINEGDTITIAVEGVSTIYMRAKDRMGNVGPLIQTTFRIDTHTPTITSIIAGEGEWNTDKIVPVTVIFDDDGGSGLDTTSLRYRTSTTGSADTAFSTWMEPMSIDSSNDGTETTVTFNAMFEEGTKNYIQVEATDILANGVVRSDKTGVFVDLTNPSTHISKPSNNSAVGDVVEIEVHIEDEISLVSSSSLEYKIERSTSNDGPWTLEQDWTARGVDLLGVTSLQAIADLTIEENLTHHTYNKFSFRVSDNAGNRALLDGTLVVAADLAPEPVIASPEDGYQMLQGSEVLLDATGTTDADDTSLTYFWSSNMTGDLGEGKTVSVDLAPGTHIITLTVSDGFLSVTATVLVEVEPLETTEVTSEGVDATFIAWIIVAALALLVAAAIIGFITIVISSVIREKRYFAQYQMAMGAAQAGQSAGPAKGPKQKTKIRVVVSGPFSPEDIQRFKELGVDLDQIKLKYNAYELLGIAEDATPKDIKKAYRKLASTYHPDRVAQTGGDKEEAEEKIRKINEAKGILEDPLKRGAYDIYLKGQKHDKKLLTLSDTTSELLNRRLKAAVEKLEHLEEKGLKADKFYKGCAKVQKKIEASDYAGADETMKALEKALTDAAHAVGEASGGGGASGEMKGYGYGFEHKATKKRMPK